MDRMSPRDFIILTGFGGTITIGGFIGAAVYKTWHTIHTSILIVGGLVLVCLLGAAAIAFAQNYARAAGPVARHTIDARAMMPADMQDYGRALDIEIKRERLAKMQGDRPALTAPLDVMPALPGPVEILDTWGQDDA